MKKNAHLLLARYAPFIILLLNPFLSSAQWVRKADGIKLRSEVGETIIYNGKLYAFVGFSDVSRHAELSSEVYDPVTDNWTPIASMPANTAMTHQDIILIDNTVWHIGGRVGQNPGPLSSAIWIYNITNNSWSRGPEIINPATGQPLVIAASGSALLGRVLHVFGGFTPTACTNDQDKYHLTLDVDTWLANPAQPAQWENRLKPLPIKRNHLSALTLGGKIYAIGGQTDHDCLTLGKDVAYCHVYNPVTDNWTQLPSLPTARSHAEGSTFAIDGKIYMAGGQGSDGKSSKYFTVFDPAANNGAGTWTENSSLALPYIYEGCSVTIIGNSLILSHGSQGTSKYPLKETYARSVTRNPVYKLGFPKECVNLSDATTASLKGHTWLYTIDGTKSYTTSSNAAWLVVNKNATGIANPNAVDIEVTANPEGLSPGKYDAMVTATGTGAGPEYSVATLCVTLTIQQNAQALEYNLAVNVNGSGTVSKSPDQISYNSGSTVTLTATPVSGQQFTGWSGAASGTANPLTVIMNGDKSITANFTSSQYTLQVLTSGIGTVTTTPGLVAYSNGNTVSLKANPGSGQQFTGWSGSASGTTNPLNITMNSAKIITANFQSTALITNLTKSSTKSYAVAQLKTGVAFYTDRTYKVTSVPAFINLAPFIRTPNDDRSSKVSSLLQFNVTQRSIIYVAYDPRATSLPLWLNGWQKSTATLGITDAVLNHLNLYSKVYPAGKVILGGNMASPAAGAQSNYIVIAVAQPVQYNLSVTGNGTVSRSPNQSAYNTGTAVTLTAIPSGGQHFTGWSGSASGSTNPLTITMTSDKNISANFSSVQYGLTTNTNGNGSISRSPDQLSYANGSTVTLTATADAGEQFTGWSGSASGNTNPLTITMNADKNITANFAAAMYNLSTNTNGNGSVSRSPDQLTYAHGSTVTLTATPDAGEQFSGWSGSASGSTNPLTITMNSGKNITANFSAATYDLSTNTKGNGSISRNPDQLTYSHGATVTLTATPDDGEQFSGWSGSASGSTNPLTITMNADKNITANFAAATYELTTNTNGSGSVVKDPDQLTYAHGSTVTLTATAEQGSQFAGWSDDGEGTGNPLVVIINANKTITANFETVTMARSANRKSNVAVNQRGTWLQEKANGTPGVKVFPNPFTGNRLTLQISPVEPQQQVTITITDVLGKIYQVIKEAPGKTGTLSRMINFEKTLSAGIYILKINSPAVNRVVKIIVN